MVRKFILAGALAAGAVALLMGPAAAQMPMGMKFKNDPKQLTPEERAKRKAIDEAYREANKKIPEKSGVNDPWGSVRSLSPSANARQ